MATSNVSDLMQHLITGLEVLQDDYTHLFEQHSALEHKLATAREQYNELAKLYGKTAIESPPLSLASASLSSKKDEDRPLSATRILAMRRQDQAAKQLRAANDASQRLLAELKSTTGAIDGKVKIWSGPSADESAHSNGRLPSITESPMEQDFTVAGTPSRLGCPFASMTGRKLSSHAASVLSRYHGSQQDGRNSSRDAASAVGSNDSKGISRHGSSQHRSAKRRSSLVDPIRAEICGLDDQNHGEQQPAPDNLHTDVENVPDSNAEVGVCPIRFLNQHSPEELATYFERHKHELPRSHEVCVRRYQSNEDQVRELDARYGDVAQMIRGLGEKHQSYLPKEPDDEVDEEVVKKLPEDDARVHEWAVKIDVVPDMPIPSSGAEQKDDAMDEHESRQSHFDRPLRDVRVGESPSRPWGISIPAQYLERKGSNASSVPAQIKVTQSADQNEHTIKKSGGCPFAALGMGSTDKPANGKNMSPELPEGHPPVATSPIEVTSVAAQSAKPLTTSIFSGPIVVGYGPEEAALFLKTLGLNGQ